MRNGSLPQTFNTLSNERHKVPNYVIGDPAYPLTPYCMKEFESCTANAQVLFNELLRSARNQIECSFGRLKARWSILTRKIDFNTEMVPTVIYACFVLHNFGESRGCSLDEEAVKAQMRRNQIEEDINKNIPDPIYSCTTGEGVVVRDTLASLSPTSDTKENTVYSSDFKSHTLQFYINFRTSKIIWLFP